MLNYIIQEEMLSKYFFLFEYFAMTKYSRSQDFYTQKRKVTDEGQMFLLGENPPINCSPNAAA